MANSVHRVDDVGRPSWRSRSTEVPRSVDRKAQVGRPRYPQSVDRVAQVGRPKSSRGSGTFSSDQPNSPIMPEQSSDRPFPTLRRTSDNSPPYFESCRAESLIKQGGESRHVRRRASPSRAGRYYPYTPRGYYRETLKGYTDNPLVGIPTHPQWVIPTHPQGVLPIAPKGVLPKSPRRSGDGPSLVIRFSRFAAYL